MENLKKYDNHGNVVIKTFAIVPQDVINSDLGINEIGLYCFLVSKSGSLFQYNGIIGMPQQNVKSLVSAINWGSRTENNAIMQSFLNRLEKAGFIKIKHFGEYFDILFPKLKQKQGYAKIYPQTVSQIKAHSKGGKYLLRRLGLYSILRSYIYENGQSNGLLDKSNNYLAKVTGLSPAALGKHMQWFRENGVLAFYKCKLNRMIGYEKYYYADMPDCHKLTTVIKGFIKQGEVLEVVE